MISTVSLMGLRAIAQSLIDESEHQIDEIGPAAQEAARTRMRCRAVILVLDVHPDGLVAMLGRAIAATPTNAAAAGEIPPRIKRSLDDYAAHGLRTGECMHAVLCNDLRRALANADDEVSAAMPAIVTYVSSCLPCNSWGSPEAVAAWIRRPRS